MVAIVTFFELTGGSSTTLIGLFLTIQQVLKHFMEKCHKKAIRETYHLPTPQWIKNGLLRYFYLEIFGSVKINPGSLFDH